MNTLFKWVSGILLAVFIIEGIAQELEYKYDYFTFTTMYCDFNEKRFEFIPSDIIQRDELFFTFEDENNFYHIPIRACYQIESKEDKNLTK